MKDHSRPKITFCSNRGQGMILVMSALDELGGRNTKHEVIEHISAKRYYYLTRHDLPAYDNKSEPKYHTLLAWARKDCVLRNLLLNDERDAWALSRHGREALTVFKRKFENLEWDIRKCYLWTPTFKVLMCSRYVPSELDAERPEELLDRIYALILD